MQGKKFSYAPLFIILSLATGCNQLSSSGTDQGNTLDLASSDRSTNIDLAKPATDLGPGDFNLLDQSTIDSAKPIDLATSPDLTVPVDMTPIVPLDLTLPPDLAQPPVDMTQSPADLTTPPPIDMTTATDGMSVMCGNETADCNMNPLDGCETPLNTAENCGACGNKCQAAGSTNMCVKTGNSYACANTCDSAHADCNNSSADGCEVTIASDPGEVDNTCGQSSEFKINDVDEGQSTSVTDHRILPLGDTDTYRVKFKESTKSCIPGTTQKFAAIVTLEPPASTPLVIRTSDGFTCNNFWPNETPTTRCVEWTGHCGADDSRNVYFQIGGFNNQAASCLPYKVTFRACNRGSTCGDCK